jgi:hypothetical protein
MLDTFSSFIPGAWFDEAGLSKGGHAQEETRAKRERRWTHSVKSMAISVISVAALAIASLFVSEGATASNLLAMVAPQGMSPVGRAPGPEATLGQINESFKGLFAAFREGVELVTNDRTLRLAEKAAARRNDRPKDWARKLASDVGDASD